MRIAPALSLLFLAATASLPAFAESCGDTTFSALGASACRGSFVGNINGSAAELSYLDSQWSNTFTYLGKSDDAGSGPFTSKETGTTNVTLTFDQAISGTFVIGLKAAHNYSYYLFNAATPVSSLTFSSTAGIALNNRDSAQGLSHASLYVAAVPEPESYALMIAGLGLMGVVARRRAQARASA